MIRELAQLRIMSHYHQMSVRAGGNTNRYGKTGAGTVENRSLSGSHCTATTHGSWRRI